MMGTESTRTIDAGHALGGFAEKVNCRFEMPRPDCKPAA
jgi:hypothetical protein